MNQPVGSARLARAVAVAAAVVKWGLPLSSLVTLVMEMAHVLVCGWMEEQGKGRDQEREREHVYQLVWGTGVWERRVRTWEEKGRLRRVGEEGLLVKRMTRLVWGLQGLTVIAVGERWQAASQEHSRASPSSSAFVSWSLQVRSSLGSG